MSWTRLCKAAELPPKTMAMVRVEGNDVLVLNTGEALLAMPPLCPKMRGPLLDTDYGACFDADKPACNRYSKGEARTVGAIAQRLRYPTRTVDGELEADLANPIPMLEFEHATCSPKKSGSGKACLIVNLWQSGFDNRTVRIGTPED